MVDDWQDGMIQTGADLLLKKVAEEEEISVTDAADDLGIREAQVEDLADALASGGFLEKSYSARKGTILKYTDENHEDVKESLRQSREELKQEARKAEDELANRKKIVQEARERLEDMKEDVEEDRRKEEETKKEVEELKELEKDIEERLNQKETKINSLRQDTADLLSRTETAISDISEAEDEIEDFTQREEELKTKLESLRKLEEHVEDIDDVQESLKEIDAAERESKSMARKVFDHFTNLFKPDKNVEEAAENILDRSVSEAKQHIRKAEQPDFETLLRVEKQRKDRKTMKRWLRRRTDD
jgi:chromosome segregation ATPase